MKTIILVIILTGGTDGGRAIDTRLRFGTMKVCEEAAQKIMALRENIGMWKPSAVCIQGE